MPPTFYRPSQHLNGGVIFACGSLGIPQESAPSPVPQGKNVLTAQLEQQIRNGELEIEFTVIQLSTGAVSQAKRTIMERNLRIADGSTGELMWAVELRNAGAFEFAEGTALGHGRVVSDLLNVSASDATSDWAMGIALVENGTAAQKADNPFDKAQAQPPA